jgi:hypothetical protein
MHYAFDSGSYFEIHLYYNISLALLYRKAILFIQKEIFNSLQKYWKGTFILLCKHGAWGEPL